jgi:tetratricopeptide (TPR) repeat protein
LQPKILASSADREAARNETLACARTALNADRPQEAARIADEMLKINPRDGQALRIRGAALLMQKRAGEAIASLETAALALRDAETDTLLAMALRQCGRAEEALSRLKRASKRRPPYAPAFAELGYSLMSRGQYDEAIETLHRGLEVAPMMPQLSIQLGEVFLQCRNYIEAKTAYARALELAPDSADALFGFAKAHQALGEHAPAADLYRRCLPVQPNHAAAWLNLGHCLLQLGQTEAGYECFRTAARGGPKSYGRALTSFAAAGRGRLWLKPSAAARFLSGKR